MTRDLPQSPVGGKPRVTVRQGWSGFTMHRPDGWRRRYLSDEIYHWTPEGFCAAWLDVLAWAATPADSTQTPPEAA